MPLPVIADTYRMALLWTGPGGQHAVNVLHFRKASSNAASVAGTMDSNVVQNMWEGVVSSFSVTRLDVTPLDGSSATYSLAVAGAKWTGPASGEFLPQGAVINSFRTALRGRSYRGRIYLPGLAEGENTNGTRLAVDVTAAQTAWNTWMANMVAATQIPVVASYLHSVATPIVSIICEPQIATQRRRMSRLRI